MNNISTDNKKIFINAVAQNSGIGKTLLVDRITPFLRQGGYEVKVFRIESKRGNLRLFQGDVHIDTAQIKDAANKLGGLLDLFKPVTDHLQTLADDDSKQAIVIDWGGGNIQHALQIHLESGIEDELEEFGFTNFMFIVSTLQAVDLKDAIKIRSAMARSLPSFNIYLCINERDFKVDQMAPPSRPLYKQLCADAGEKNIIKMPLIAHRSNEIFSELNYELEALMVADIQKLVKLTGMDRFVLKLGQTSIRKFRNEMEVQLSTVFPFCRKSKTDEKTQPADAL